MKTQTAFSFQELATAQSVINIDLPNYFDDIVLRVSARSDSNNASEQWMWYEFGWNNIGRNTTVGGRVYVARNGDPGAEGSMLAYMASSTNTANTFGVSTVVISDYNSTLTEKAVWIESSVPSNIATGSYRSWGNGLLNATQAVTSIQLYPRTGNFVAGTTVTAYGIIRNNEEAITVA